MYVVDHTCLQHLEIRGCRATKVAGRPFGIESFEIWTVAVEPGSVLAPPLAEGEQVVFLYGGGGVLTVGAASREVRIGI